MLFTTAGDLEECSREWYERIESHRYAVETFIHSIAQFTRHSGKPVLEVGVGPGADHLQWARAGCEFILMRKFEASCSPGV